VKTPVALFLLVLTQAASRGQQATQSGSIEGKVTLETTGVPLPRAQVTLKGLMLAPSGRTDGQRADTDDQGRFSFQGLAQGVYGFEVLLDGYILNVKNQPLLPSGVGNPSLILAAGQPIKDVNLRMVQPGVVSGRIVADSGQPLSNITVSLVRKQYDKNGNQSPETWAFSTTNERGEYRISGAPHSRYYLYAAAFADFAAAFAHTVDPAQIYQGKLYSGVQEMNAATALDVRPGSSQALKDLVLEKQHLYTIRGRVIDANGKPPAKIFVWNTASMFGGDFPDYSQPQYNATTGAFELHNVVGPANYLLGVTDLSETYSPPGVFPPALPLVFPEISINVTNADVNGILFTVKPPVYRLRGRITVDGQPLSSMPGWESVRAELKHSRSGFIQEGLREPFTLPLLEPAGTFQISSPTPGELRLRVTGLPADAYIKEGRLGSKDVLNQALVFDGSPDAVLEVTLGAKGGRIEGTAGQAGVLVVLVPDQHRDRLDLYKTATTDAAGRFTFRGVAPGEYRVFAWSSLEPYAYFDSDVLKQSESGSSPVHITEATTVNVSVRVNQEKP